jgi:hypothetical protein
VGSCLKARRQDGPEQARQGPAARWRTGRRGRRGGYICAESGEWSGLLIFPSMGGSAVEVEGGGRQRQPNRGAGKRARDEAKTGGDDGRKEETRPPFLWAESHTASGSGFSLSPLLVVNSLNPNPLSLSKSAPAFSLQIRSRFLSLGVYCTLCFGGLVACFVCQVTPPD